MAVGFDTSTESATASTGSTSVASFSWSHTGAASGVKGVLVFVFNLTAATDTATSVTYGGVTVPAVTSGFGSDTVTEPGFCKAFFLGSGVLQSTQTVVVNRTNNANVMYAVAITTTAATDTEAGGVVTLNENQALAQQSVTDTFAGVAAISNSMRFAGTYSGLATHPPAGAASTELQFFPATAGTNCCSTVRETTAGQGARNVGFAASTDDVGAVHLAVREIPPRVATQVIKRQAINRASTF